jgi:diguanylate cyclase (GGDEF)-like protein/PAS domain S-box-containing protein
VTKRSEPLREGPFGVNDLYAHFSEPRLIDGMLDALPGIFYVFDADGRFLMWNANFARVSKYGDDEIAQMLPTDFFAGEERNNIGSHIARVFAEGSSFAEGRFCSKGGTVTPYYFTGHRLVVDGTPLLVGMGIDISERREIEERLQRLALVDPLTNLANRNVLTQKLDTELLRNAEGAEGLLLFLDFDRFKGVNDSLGHHRGDRLLKLVADRLYDMLDPEDTVARHGGDEFIIILPGARRDAAATIAQRILDAFRDPFVVDAYSLHVTCSIGICIYPQDGADSATLIRNADMAMYAAKRDGRNTFRFFAPEMSERADVELQLGNDLYGALERGELVLWYQPVVNIADGRIAGFESLLRWNHPQRGMLLADDFIRLAEDIGLIDRVGTWVCEEAGRQIRRWEIAGYADAFIGVNVSPMQLSEPTFAERLKVALAVNDADATRLVVELTERTYVDGEGKTSETIRGLHELGVRVVIDDFGTGYSSLGYLTRIEPAGVKIDKSFVAQLETGKGAAAIVEAVVALGKALGFVVIAEGVETRAQLERLRAVGCTFAQGFLYDAALPVAAATALLANGATYPPR